MSDVNPQIEIFPASSLEDVELLRPALESAVRNPFNDEIFYDEIAGYMREVEAVRQGSTKRYYAIARTSGGLTVGMMGLQKPIPELEPFFTTDNPVELINAYLLRTSRGQGVGRALVNHLEDKARNDGYTELLLNSGPRYARSGWPFWRRTYGEPVGEIKDYYGPRFHAKVWRTDLN